MARNFDWLYEFIDTESPGDSSIAPGATEATLFFIISGDDLTRAFIDILGYTKFSDKKWGGIATGGLTRQIEMSHPRYPYLYAESVEIVGLSPNGNQNSRDFDYATKIFNTLNNDPAVPIDYKTFYYMDVYKKYRLSVKFTSRNYFLLTDEQLAPAIDPTGVGIPRLYSYYIRDYQRPDQTRPESYRDYREYLRYCELTIEPANEILANSNGKLYWKSTPPGQVLSGPPNPYQESPIGAAAAPVNFVNVTKNKVKIKWYKVPKITSFNSQYTFATSLINYGANYDDDGDVDIFNYEFFNFAPGTLLFTGITIEENNSSFPIIPFTGKTREDMLFNVMRNQYINITFNFIQFVVPRDQLILPNVQNIAWSTRGKMYSNGWNFVPTPTLNFYYVESANVERKETAWCPYMSFPMQKLFDPQAS